ncbi:prolipoprotein diacylglyceryl transferase family protein [Zobellia nedashkovskayae]|uniref:prolipoprotein diacylglyceryl transferase family protein n=1 Tax=Zobellia nedashkovskayae TaxID=2779510 RepID=UPI00188D98F6|nr:prolipoprotein diacylglyceryl transferase family protein [Zobellia nedashkovskayae]
MKKKFFDLWTSTPILRRTENYVFVWFGVILGTVILFAVPTVLIMSHLLPNSAYTKFFYDFFKWWPLFSIGGSIFLFHDFWFKLNKFFKLILSGKNVKWQRPGAVFYGGFIGSSILIFLLGNKYNLSTFYALDFIFLIIPFYHGLSRLACLNYGCCYGKKCSTDYFLKISFSHPDSEPVRHGIVKGTFLHPVQLYEGILCVLIGLLLVFLLGKVGSGKIFSVYLISYGIVRFFLEYFRDNTHEKVYFNLISIWQVLSLVFLVVGVLLLYLLPQDDGLILMDNFTDFYLNDVAYLTIWNCLAITLTFGLHFRKLGEPL